MIEPIPFVADGHERAREGICAQVEAEYAERLKVAMAEEVPDLRREMRLAIAACERRLAKQESLY